MPKKILFAFDGSDASQRAFDVALEMAEKFQAPLLVLAVVRLPEPITSLELGALLDNAKEHYEQSFAGLRERAAARGVALETAIEVGHPAEHIVGRAEREHYDHIIMGRSGTTQFARLLLGSVSERVLSYAHCPVTVVK